MSQTAIAADFTGDGRTDVIVSEAGADRSYLYAAPDWKSVILQTRTRAIHSAVIDPRLNKAAHRFADIQHHHRQFNPSGFGQRDRHDHRNGWRHTEPDFSANGIRKVTDFIDTVVQT